jgi:hypothetical protein
MTAARRNTSQNAQHHFVYSQLPVFSFYMGGIRACYFDSEGQALNSVCRKPAAAKCRSITSCCNKHLIRTDAQLKRTTAPLLTTHPPPPFGSLVLEGMRTISERRGSKSRLNLDAFFCILWSQRPTSNRPEIVKTPEETPDT